MLASFMHLFAIFQNSKGILFLKISKILRKGMPKCSKANKISRKIGKLRRKIIAVSLKIFFMTSFNFLIFTEYKKF